MTERSRTRPILHAAAAGIATGMRSNSAIAAASAAAHRGGLATGNGWADRLLRWRGTTLVFGLATAGELVIDKLPMAPSRLEPAPLIGRAVLGGLAGAIVSRGRGGSPLTGLLAGCAGALVSTQVWGRGRAAIEKRTGIPDPMIAVIEDGLALAIAYRATNGETLQFRQSWFPSRRPHEQRRQPQGNPTSWRRLVPKSRK